MVVAVGLTVLYVGWLVVSYIKAYISLPDA
jgi:uncharacterized membrane protein YhdT